MKKVISAVLIAVLLLTTLCLPAFAEGTKTVAASFYPIYILLRNVTDGVSGIDAVCLASENTGCLHDYQLLPGDLISLSESDALFICGAGMETYLGTVSKNFPELSVIDTSEGVELIEESREEHEGEGGDEHEHEANAHIWLSVPNAIIMVKNIESAMCRIDSANAQKYSANAQAYIARLETLEEYIVAALTPYAGRKIVTFHEAFPYFAEHYGIEVCEVVNIEHGDTISAMRLSEVIDAVISNGLPPLFTEPQYSDSAAKIVASETGAGIFELDPIVTGEFSLTAYEDGMRRNADALVSAFSEKN
ncbi:MAG: metal ABC transporter substrate-binding protein [Eubacteriales bacterium]|nr:metal ABC transporter substrate-binding protein [Eubacteriales bacterium]MDD3880698.1 metal ABC transporter substrate-binding protein [Eubacteriales bacterium]MDD4511668.1 metal ABC transporter substrate-binding protein [Eubacteriales bacterium]